MAYLPAAFCICVTPINQLGDISITEALMNKPNEPKELLDELEAAAYLGLKNHKTLAVWRCNKRYDLPYVKYGRLVRYRRKDLQAFVDAHLVPTR